MSESKPTVEEIDHALAAAFAPPSDAFILRSAINELVTLRAIWAKAEPLLRALVADAQKERRYPERIIYQCRECQEAATSWDAIRHEDDCRTAAIAALLGEGGQG